MKTSEKRKQHHAKYKWKLVRRYHTNVERRRQWGWREGSEGGEEVTRVRRRHQGWGVGSEVEEKVKEKKCKQKRKMILKS